MPSAEQLRSRLLKKLSELFQLDQPDLDFGFYRIMHAKAQEVQDFVGTDLLKIVADAFGDADEARKAGLKARIDEEIAAAKEYGVADPEHSPKVKEARAAYEAAKDTASAEADVYDHLYRFFERYYDDGDFISRRYYTRETSGKAAPFAVPYNGEEVKLHWANADQYYIKSAEYFSNFTFDLRQAKEVQATKGSLPLGNDEKPLKVRFRIVDATEGEHGNVKASEANKRFFILHAENPVALTETGELVVNFEYRPDPEKTGQENTWRDKRNTEAVETILERLQAMAAAGGEHEKQIPEYLRLFKVPAPTDSDKKRPVLAKYVNQYTARNTMDYFIHKDLGGFLRRELDFYIKNEVMRLDDIENAEAPTVESYLAKIKALRKIAGKLIDFLAQLEDFQKKLWLKKKFIIETNYCITLDRIPEELYPEIAENEAQIDEWVKLFAIDEIGASHEDRKAQSGDLFDKGIVPFSRPLTVEFLKANNKLVLDTRFFDDSFKARLVASIENFDEQCDGLLIHSENFQALNLLQERYREQVKCVYIDPPYNAQSSEILYKNTYKHSSWLTLIKDRANAVLPLYSKPFVHVTAIDEVENFRLGMLFDNLYPDCEDACISIVHNPTGQQGNNFSFTHEFAHFIFPKGQNCIGLEERNDDNREANPDIRPLRNVSSGNNHLRESAANCFYPIYVKEGKIVGFGDVCDVDFHPTGINQEAEDGVIEVYPIDPQGVESKWVFARNTVESILGELSAEFNKKKGTWDIVRKKSRFRYKSLWEDKRYSANSWGSVILNSMLPGNPFTYPKSIYTVRDCIDAALKNQTSGDILDYFAGSGTTSHAVINLNREDGGKRKYILVEMGDYFDTVLKPRIAKVVYSESWKDGKPTARHTGVSHCFKYIRLESYEDTLNNLRLDEYPVRKKAVAANPALKEDYLLRYLLDVETRGSQSLLNIDAFADPTFYTLDVKKPGTDEYATRAVDLIETFNYLIGLRVIHTSVPQTFQATFKRITDPELPQDQHTKLVVDGRIRQDEGGPWWFRKVEGWVPKDAANPNNGQRDKVLVVWRKLTGDIEQDNLMLDEWFQKNRIITRDFEFDTIYVNGSNNLPNLKLDNENWKVCLIEEEFMKRMWATEGA
ncbi:DNA methyltransferase [Noviherbaspirillum sp.]|uniref:DNA methyltransferase n=1 Tax=Noviherbaspirillum sp. TaxID=1926288 RepID=UPI002FE043BE